MWSESNLRIARHEYIKAGICKTFLIRFAPFSASERYQKVFHKRSDLECAPSTSCMWQQMCSTKKIEEYLQLVQDLPGDMVDDVHLSLAAGVLE